MIGVSLSRWTMSYFAAALFSLVTAESFMAGGYGYPNAAIGAPETLILVHVVAIGWLSLLMCGALFQFVPVLVAHPLHSNRLPLPTLLALLAGLAALILGFLQLAGRIDPAPPFFVFASVLLACGFALTLWNLTRTLVAAQTWPLPARFVMVGLVSLVATAGLGIIFALVIGGSTTYPPFVALTGSGLVVHAIAGLGGWLTFAAVGVSYRLLAMFMLAPELERTRTKGVLYLGASALAFALGGGALAIVYDKNVSFALLASGVFGLAAFVLYGSDVVHLYRARKRHTIELNSRMAALALASLAISIVLIIVLLGLGQLKERAAAVVFLAAFGWLSGLGLAQLYKIVAFLTWLECYGPVLGKVSTPRVQDLVVERRATKWFLLYFLAVWAGTVTLIIPNSSAFRGAAAAMLIATIGIVAQLVCARRLTDVNAAVRLPIGVHKPRLLFSFPDQS